MTRSVWCVLLLATSVALAEDKPKPAPEARRPAGAAVAPARAAEDPNPKDDPNAKESPKSKEAPDLGMSILGNQEAPKALVIVPWKASEMGDAHGISTMLDDSRLPIDKEVFMRLLSYYEIRSDGTLHQGAPAAGPKAAPTGTTATPTATPRRKS
jgi:hypothetical protein